MSSEASHSRNHHKYAFFVFNLMLLKFLSSSLNTNNSSDETYSISKTIYEFTAKDINGNEIPLSKYKGKVCLIVNVACNCGLTASNYPELQYLYTKYYKKGLRILAFPSNQFAGQEPRPEPEIKDFVKRFNVEFDMFSKINVNGDDAHPLYKYLKEKCGGLFGNFIKWNFTKFLVNKNGEAVKRYSPTVKPIEIEHDIVSLLNSV